MYTRVSHTREKTQYDHNHLDATSDLGKGPSPKIWFASYPVQGNLNGTFPGYTGKKGGSGFEAEWREESLYKRAMATPPPQVLGRFSPKPYTRMGSQRDASGVGPNYWSTV